MPLVAMALALTMSTPALVEPHPNGESLAGGQAITRTDENGTFRLAFQCLATEGRLNWGFTFNPQWRAMASGPVTGDGMGYWCNGRRMPRNTRHIQPVDYSFHGTLPEVFVGEDIDYQDFFSFRADFGGATGTARVAIAGSVILTP